MSKKIFRGFSLIEVVISLFLLSILLIGMDAMQVTALREEKNNFYYNYAWQQLNALRILLRTTHCQINSDLFNQWNQENINNLPQGRGEILSDKQRVKLIIRWGNEIANNRSPRSLRELAMTNDDCETNAIGETGCIMIHAICS